MQKDKTIVWSYSSISKYETCPYQWKCNYIDKSIKFIPNAATTWGSESHEALDKRLRTKEPMSDRFRCYEKYALAVESLDGFLESEKEVAIDAYGNSVSFWDKSATERGKLDVFVNHMDGRASIIDWKTGSYRPSEELEYFTTLIMATNPDVERIKTTFLWFKNDAPPTVSFYNRNEYGKLRQKFDDKIERIEESLMQDNFPKKKSGLCKNYCGSPSCQHSGSYDKFYKQQ